MRPAIRVAQEVHRRVVTVSGAAKNYGVVVRPSDFTINEGATAELREKIREDRKGTGWSEEASYNRGGTMREVIARCEEETGLKPPRPQWERDPYGPHVGLEYVKKWYGRMREGGMDVWDKA
jgi:5-oxoprolinase (ATP-hydrolysing)